MAAADGCKLAISCIRCTGRPRAQEHDFGSLLLHEGSETRKIAPIGRGIIALRQNAGHGDVGLVHELGGGDTAADRCGIAEKMQCLIGCPSAGRVAGAAADRERRHDVGADCAREIDHAFPLPAGQNLIESGRRRRWRVVRIGKIGGVGPGAADPHIGRRQRRGQLSQPRVGQIDRRAVGVFVRARRTRSNA